MYNTNQHVLSSLKKNTMKNSLEKETIMLHKKKIKKKKKDP